MRFPARPRSILVLKPCCLGDVLAATALVRELRLAFPDTKLDFAVGRWSQPAVETNPRIDELIDCGRVGSGRYSPAEYLELVRQIRARRYEVCFVPERSVWLTMIPWLAGIPVRVGIDSGGRGFSLTVRVPWRPPRNEAELYLDLLRAVGIEPRNPRVEFFPRAEDRVWARGILGPHRPRVVIQPGGGVNPGMVLPAKRWPPDRFVEIGRRVLELGGTVVVIGTAWDRAAVTPVLRRLQGLASPGRLVNLVDGVDFVRLGAVLAEADLFIGPDSGPMHLAAAVGTPTVAIFGPSSPEVYRPLAPNVVTLYNPVPTSPCFVNGRWNAACRNWACIRAVSVDEVWAAAARLLADRLAGPIPGSA
jgi:lipopolysaccharide heptosyltransferase II